MLHSMHASSPAQGVTPELVALNHAELARVHVLQGDDYRLLWLFEIGGNARDEAAPLASTGGSFVRD